MGFTVDEFNQAKSDMTFAINKALDDAEQLRKAELEGSSDGSAVAPTGLLEVPGGIEVSLVEVSREAIDSLGNPIGKSSV